MKSRFLNYALAMVFLVLSIFVSAKEYHRIEKVKDQKQIEQSTTNVDIGVTRYVPSVGDGRISRTTAE